MAGSEPDPAPRKAESWEGSQKFSTSTNIPKIPKFVAGQEPDLSGKRKLGWHSWGWHIFCGFLSRRKVG